MNKMENIPTKPREPVDRPGSQPASQPSGLLQRVTGRARRLQLAHWIWLGAVALVALVLAVLAWPRPTSVEAATVDRGLVTRDVIDEARTRIEDVFVISAPVRGELQRIELEPGDSVAEGQVIATILPADPALLDARIAAEAGAAVNAAQAALNAAQADLDLQRRDHARVAKLHERGFASQAALDTANAALRSAEAAVKARAADLQRARASASRRPAGTSGAPVPVRAPAAGQVLRLMRQSAAVVAPGEPLMEIGDPGNLEIVAEFLSQDAVLISAGAAAFVESWGGGDQPIPARVVRVEPFGNTEISALGVEEQRVNVIARLDKPEAAPELGHGFRVDLRVIVSQQDNVLRVPIDALVRDGAGWAVFRIEGGRARLRPVEVGDGGDRYRAVRSGLEQGDRVVLFPGDTLEDGARVSPEG